MRFLSKRPQWTLRIPLLPPTRTGLHWRRPSPDVVHRHLHHACFILDKLLEEIAHPFLVYGMDVVVPLFEPRKKFQNPCKQRDTPFGLPALVVLHPFIVGSYGLCLLKVIPSGPSDHRGLIDVAFAKWKADEPLLGNIELLAQGP